MPEERNNVQDLYVEDPAYFSPQLTPSQKGVKDQTLSSPYQMNFAHDELR
jgi:hypothetical protein